MKNQEFVSNDDELVDLLLNDKTREVAYKQLVRLYSKKIYWLVRRLVLDHDDANDVVQEVFIKIYNNLKKFKRESKLYTWIYTIATNEAINFINKKAKKNNISFEEVAYEQASNLESDRYFDGDEMQLFLQKQVAKLPPQQRLVFQMKYYQEMKYEEIAEVLKLTVGALKSNYHHAAKKIEEAIKNHKYEE